MINPYADGFPTKVELKFIILVFDSMLIHFVGLLQGKEAPRSGLEVKEDARNANEEDQYFKDWMGISG